MHALALSRRPKMVAVPNYGLRWLLDEPFKDRLAYVVVRDAAGAAKVETVQALTEVAVQ